MIVFSMLWEIQVISSVPGRRLILFFPFAKLPKELKMNRFDRLTESPTKVKFRPFVYELYPETIEVKKRSDGTEYEEKTYPMDDSFKYENYERVLKILRAVEYLPKD